jgi:hypothetical protein
MVPLLTRDLTYFLRGSVLADLENRSGSGSEAVYLYDMKMCICIIFANFTLNWDNSSLITYKLTFKILKMLEKPCCSFMIYHTHNPQPGKQDPDPD